MWAGSWVYWEEIFGRRDIGYWWSEDSKAIAFLQTQTWRWARPGQGLWIVPSYGVHTIGMLFSIDIVFLDRSNHVVHIEEHVRPFRISKVILKADSVLELPPHTIFRTRTHVGDLFEIGPLPTPAKSRSVSAPQPSGGVAKNRTTVGA